MSDDVLVVVGPGVTADPALLAEIAEREFAGAGVSGALVHAQGAAHVRSLVSDGTVVLPGPRPEVRALMERPLGAVVWVDLERVDGVTALEGATHLHGRGIGGLAWGIRHAVHRARHPSRRIAYGPEPEQWGDLYTPGNTAPAVVLIHGGYWRSIWAADLMEALCADLAGRGLAVWNLEYRRPDLHGWRATTADIAAGLAALGGLGDVVDLGRVAVAGHSAGAQLALRAVADGARVPPAVSPPASPAVSLPVSLPVSLVVSLAGVLDLVQGERRWLSAGAVAAALGESGDADASPLLRVPVGVPQLVVQGAGDDLDLVDFGRRYARVAREAGDNVKYLEMVGDHFDVITPSTPIWQATAHAITEALT
ncbi:Acetyl esterase/lipase [Nonomuraea solani]|uniref:Acetyl esterase/lipase n=1 Tax=Nonomuraea solani TaxID=1144553 RepID=A0A1H6E0K3_9ACTN|nr:alpha/beta hydrolase [Nonomuraea solani]SEG91130.1 Acetyl esterase/lipase [Nonomuraea solani]